MCGGGRKTIDAKSISNYSKYEGIVCRRLLNSVVWCLPGAMYRFAMLSPLYTAVFLHSFATLVESIFPVVCQIQLMARFLAQKYLSLTKVKEISGSFWFFDIILR